MKPVDPAVAVRRLLAGEDPEAVLAGAHGPARSALVRGVVALLRPTPGPAVGDPEDMLRALVRRATLRDPQDAGLAGLRVRAARADVPAALAVLDRVPNVPPDPCDRLL